jgi:hypothetical protein
MLSLMLFCLVWQTVFFPKQICKEYHVSVDLDWTLLQCKSDDEYGEMQEIIASRDLEHQSDARWLASVYFKNSINRYWRIRRDSLWATWSFCLFFQFFSGLVSLEQTADLKQFFYAENCSQSSLLQLVGVPALSLDGFCLKYVNATCVCPSMSILTISSLALD